jgi:hypothetical protein
VTHGGGVQAQEMLDVIILAIHIEHEIDVLRGDQEALTIVASNSRLDEEVDKDFFVKSLVVVTVSVRFHVIQLLFILINEYFRRHLVEGDPNQIIISLLK